MFVVSQPPTFEARARSLARLPCHTYDTWDVAEDCQQDVDEDCVCERREERHAKVQSKMHSTATATARQSRDSTVSRHHSTAVTRTVGIAATLEEDTDGWPGGGWKEFGVSNAAMPSGES